jgi:RNA polymerase sigma factor (TIGR02999 family)
LAANPQEEAPHQDSEVTNLLRRLSEGDLGAAEELFPLIYHELHRLARKNMQGQRPDHTLQASALVNEAYLRLFRDAAPNWKDRNHFMAFAARAMRSILVDHARSKKRDKRTPGGERVSMDELIATYEERAFDLVALDDALSKLAEIDEQMVRIVELRFFAGMNVRETASVLGLSPRSVEREWQAAKALLRKSIG